MIYDKSGILGFFICVFCFCLSTLQAQIFDYEEKSPFTGVARYDAVSFVINDVAYVGTGRDGSTYFKDFYKYDPNNDVWISISDFPGDARSEAVSFSINGKGYVGTGTDGTDLFSDFYEYDPTLDQWTSVTGFSGSARRSAVAFSIGDKAYVGTGRDASDETLDFFEYDPALDQWTSIQGLEASKKRQDATSFVIGSKGYIVAGSEFDISGTTIFSDVLSYDPTSNTWNEEVFASATLSSKSDATAFVINDIAYLVGGSGNNSTVTYDPADNSITTLSDFGPESEDDRFGLISFNVNETAYVGLGATTPEIFVTEPKNDIWEFVELEEPDAPYNVFISDLEKTTVELHWSYSEPEVDGFYVYLSTDGETYSLEYTIAQSGSFYSTSISGLSEGIQYFIRVSAFNSTLESEFAETDFYTLSDLPIVVNSLNAIPDEGYTGYELNWEYGLSNADGFIIQRSENISNGYVTLDSTNAWNTTYIDGDTSLAINSTYFYHIIAYNEFGNSPSSESIEVNTTDLYPQIPTLVLRSVEDQSSNTYSHDFNIDLLLENGERIDFTQRQYAIDTNDYISESINDYVGRRYYSYGTSRADELKTYKIRYIVGNKHGMDTTNVLEVQTGLAAPRDLKVKLASQNIVEIVFDPQSNTNTETVLERSENGGLFEEVERFNVDDYFEKTGYFGATTCYDSTVSAGNFYTYRLKNAMGSIESSYSNEGSVRADQGAIWRIVTKNGTSEYLYDLEEPTLRSQFYKDGMVYLLSVEDGDFISYDVSTGVFEELNPYPNSGVINSRNSEITGLNGNYIYVTGGRDDDGQVIRDFWKYDIVNDQWSELNSLALEIDHINQRNLLFDDDGNVYFGFFDEDGLFGVSKYSIANNGYEYFMTDSEYFYWSQSYRDNNTMVFVSSRSTNNIPDPSITFNFSTLAFDEITTPNALPSSDISKTLVIYNGQNYWVNESDKKLYTYDNLQDFNIEDQGSIEAYENAYPAARDEDIDGIAFVYNDTLYYGFGRFERSGKSQGDLFFMDDKSPLPPAYFRANSVTQTSAVLQWYARNGDVDEYILEDREYDSDQGTYYYNTIATLTANELSYQLDGLEQNDYYTYYLSSKKDGISSIREDLSFRTLRGIPYPVENLNVSSRTDTSITLLWDLNTEVVIDELSVFEYNSSIDISLANDQESIELTGLTEGNDYWFVVSTKNDFGQDGSSLQASTLLTTPEITRLEEDAGQYTVIWEDHSEMETHYAVERKGINDTVFTEVGRVSLNTSRYTDAPDDLTHGIFEYRVQAQYLVEVEDSLVLENYSDYSEIFSTEDSSPPLGLSSITTNIYPNPTSNYIQLETLELVQDVLLINSEGRKWQVPNSEQIVDLTSFPPGLYILEVQFYDRVEKIKIVKE